jgi:TatD DNase family protein
MFIDTHSHLYFEQFNDDREKVVQRAIQNKVSAIITIGTDIGNSAESIKIADKFAIVYASVGIHPNDCQALNITVLDDIKEMAASQKVVAIGEIGLDYYHSISEKEKQHMFFREQLRLAKELHLPVIIHNRDAHEDVYKILVEEKASTTGAVMHSFSGSTNFLESVLAQNIYISFTGVVTFKNANYYRLIDKVPVEQLLLETDSPFLAPVPFRGKRNEPAYIKFSAEKIAQVKSIPIEKLARITTENAKSLFQLNLK